MIIEESFHEEQEDIICDGFTGGMKRILTLCKKSTSRVGTRTWLGMYLHKWLYILTNIHTSCINCRVSAVFLHCTFAHLCHMTLRFVVSIQYTSTTTVWWWFMQKSRRCREKCSSNFQNFFRWKVVFFTFNRVCVVYLEAKCFTRDADEIGGPNPKNLGCR